MNEKKEFEAAEKRVVHLFITTELNRKEIAEVMSMTGSEVGTIVSRYHAVKNSSYPNAESRCPEGLTPCMLTLNAWPQCYGQGCHFVSRNGDSECLAYNAMQNHIAKKTLTL